MRNADRPARPVTAHYQAPSQPGAHPILVPEKCGLTKREEFAKAAMQGLCADLAASEAKGYTVKPAIVARDAVQYADALLAELEKSP